MTSSATTKVTNYEKYCYFPINYPSLTHFFDQQVSVFWVPEELDLRKDRDDWDTLTPSEQRFIKFVLCFFAQFDGIVGENIKLFKEDTSFLKEAVAFYTAQDFMETIHNKTYSTLIETFIRNTEEKIKAFDAISNYPCLKKIADWVMRWMNRDISLLERVIAFACVEGVMFSGAFASIYWIKMNNKLKGLCKANEFIARDETLHTEFGVELFKVISSNLDRFSEFVTCDLVSENRAHKIISECIDISEEFIRDALNVQLLGMDADRMVEYVKCCADVLSEDLGFSRIYGTKNPFEWMTAIGLVNKTNPHEDVISEYEKVKDHKFDMDDDF